MQQIDDDLRANSSALKAGILQQLRKEFPQLKIETSRLQITVEETQHRVFKIRNAISQEFGLTGDQTHLLLQKVIGATANLNQRLAEMEAYSAITGFRESEAPLLFGKMAGIISRMNPKIVEGQFKRVIELAEIPDLRPNQRISVEQLLKVRESPECQDFRRWLSTAEGISDEDIRKLLGGVKSKLGSLVGSVGGKALRLAVTTGIGLIPQSGLVLGPMASAIDTFLVERVLPRSGILAFVTDQYPSLFESP